MSTLPLSKPSETLCADLQGVWWLQTREDRTKDGQRRIDPILGSDPIGILSYAKNHFSAQFMKRNRLANDGDTIIRSGQNNTIAVGGYDAYFGTYEVDEKTGKVLHTLIGSITPANVGMTVSRDLRVSGDQLTIQLETTTTEGEPVIRTLTWKRIS
ncbi:MAG: lipocalin-like domain-containing protein [Bacteroidota bacterium]